MRNKILLMSLGLSLNLLVSCVSVPDKPVCVEISLTRGWCTNTISDKEFFVDEGTLYEGKTWWEMRPYMILMPASTYAANKAYMIKMCKKSNACKENISMWERKFQSVEEKVGDK